jgi:signal transduction histidine kinase
MESITQIEERLADSTGEERLGLLSKFTYQLVEGGCPAEERQDRLSLAQRYSEEALSLAHELGNLMGAMRANLRLSKIYALYDNPYLAIEYIRTSEQIAREIGDDLAISGVVIERGFLHHRFLQFDEAIDAATQGLEIKRKLGEKHGMGCCLSILGMVNMQMGKLTQALEYYQEASGLLDKETFPQAEANLLNNFGITYAMQDSFEESQEAFEKSLMIRERFSDIPGVAQCHNNIGKLKSRQKKHLEARERFTKALELFDIIGDQWSIFDTRRSLAATYLALGDIDKTGKLLEDLERRMESCHGNDLEMQYWDLACRYYRVRGEFEKALDARERFHDVREELYKRDAEKRISELKIQHELERKGQEVESARIRNEELAERNEQINRQNAELERINRELHQAMAAKSKLFSIIAHDMRNPLASLQLTSEYLYLHYDRHDREYIQKHIYQIMDGSKRLNGLVDNLLLWARSQGQALPFQPEQIKVGELVNDEFRLLGPQAARKNIELVGGSGPAVAYGDRTMISAILRNLIGNAIKFTPPQGEVSVRYETADGMTAISVDDTGVGMTAEALASLFDPETNRSTRGTEGEKGSGLGLVICREFAQLNGGDITVESELNDGSSFTLKLPAGDV